MPEQAPTSRLAAPQPQTAVSAPATPANVRQSTAASDQQRNGQAANPNLNGSAISAMSPTYTHFNPQNQLILLAYSVESPWERCPHPSANGVPFYKNRQTGQLRWDHPMMTELLDTVQQFNYIRFAAYRTAMKLRVMQKHLLLDKLSAIHVKQIFKSIGEMSGSDANNVSLDTDYLDVPTICNYLILVYNSFILPQMALQSSDSNDAAAAKSSGSGAASASENGKQPLALTQSQLAKRVDIALNWILNVFDAGRSGRVRAVAFKIALILLSSAQLEEKYVFLFRLVADRADQAIDAQRLSLLLYEALQLPRQLGEIAAFGGSNTEPSVRSCTQLANGASRLTIRHFLAWANLEPQSLVWLAVLHRLIVSESARHASARCTICKQQPIVGLRYRCLRCFSVDLCQKCFFAGRACKSHKLSHPTQEYCTSTSTGVDVRDLTRICCNRLLKPAKTGRRRSIRLGYLPVQTVHEGSSVPESPLESPQLPSFTEIHSHFDMLAQRVTDAERSSDSLQRNGGNLALSSVSSGSEDHEFHLRGGFKTNGSAIEQNRVLSPLDVLRAAEQAEADELEARIRNLEEENRNLQKKHAELLLSRAEAANNGRDAFSSPNSNGVSSNKSGDADSANDAVIRAEREAHTKRTSALVNEANALRAHKARMESRLAVLEQHNAQLEVQLEKIKVLLAEHQITLPNGCFARGAPLNTNGSVSQIHMGSRMSAATSTSSVASVIGNSVARSQTPKTSAGYDARQTPTNVSSYGGGLQLAKTVNGNISGNGHTNGLYAPAINGHQQSTSGAGSTMQPNAASLPVQNSLRMVGNLFMMADEVGRAVGDVVSAYTDDEEPLDEVPSLNLNSRNFGSTNKV